MRIAAWLLLGLLLVLGLLGAIAWNSGADELLDGGVSAVDAESGEDRVATARRANVETEKAEVMLEAPAAGIIDITVAASDMELPVGTTLAFIAP